VVLPKAQTAGLPLPLTITVAVVIGVIVAIAPAAVPFIEIRASSVLAILLVQDGASAIFEDAGGPEHSAGLGSRNVRGGVRFRVVSTPRDAHREQSQAEHHSSNVIGSHHLDSLCDGWPLVDSGREPARSLHLAELLSYGFP
jgi:hypothetical protein